MTDIQVHPVHALNRYIYDLLRENLGISRANYGGKTPIIPSQQVPEFTQYSAPFLVYGFSEDASTDWTNYIRTGSAAYSIYSADDREIIKIIGVMVNSLGRMDDSARDVNEYKYNNSAFREIIFNSISVGLVEGPSPAESEAGRASGIVMLRFSYKPSYSVVTNPQMT